MGVFDFIKKQIICEKCGKEVDKKELGIYDASHQGRIKSGQKLKLCKRCLVNSLVENIKEFDGKAVIIKPSSRYNAYVYYQLEELKKSSGFARNKDWEDSLTNDMSSLLPLDIDKCCSCKNSAQFTFCTLDIFNGANPYNWEVSMNRENEKSYMCKDCLLNVLIKEFNNEGINISAVYPITKGDGFLTPWEV
jgi:hypothetical protein